MKILAVRVARSIWLAPSQFFNPSGAFLRKASLEMKERYQFAKSPYENGTAGTGDAKYERGGFLTQRGIEVAIDSIVFAAQGVVVDSTSSTEDTDAFLADLSHWLAHSYGVAPFEEVPVKKLYASELNVALDRNANFLNPGLRAFSKAVSEILDDGKVGPAGFLGFQLTTDPERSPSPKQFRFEREVGTSLESNRYWSFAPVPTPEHVRLVKLLEESL